MVSITLKEAQGLLGVALRKAEEIGVPSTIAIVDSGGHCVAKARMDGVPLVTVRMAEDKAYTSAMIHEPTGDLQQPSQPGEELFGLFAAEAGRVIIFGGGFPLAKDGDVVGAIGVAGGTAENDVEIAEAALETWPS